MYDDSACLWTESCISLLLAGTTFYLLPGAMMDEEAVLGCARYQHLTLHREQDLSTSLDTNRDHLLICCTYAQEPFLTAFWRCIDSFGS